VSSVRDRRRAVTISRLPSGGQAGVAGALVIEVLTLPLGNLSNQQRGETSVALGGIEGAVAAVTRDDLIGALPLARLGLAERPWSAKLSGSDR